MCVFPRTVDQCEAECPSKNINCGRKRRKNNSEVDWEIQEQTLQTILKGNETQIFLFDHIYTVHISSDLEGTLLYSRCILHLKYIQYISIWPVLTNDTILYLSVHSRGPQKHCADLSVSYT